MRGEGASGVNRLPLYEVHIPGVCSTGTGRCIRYDMMWMVSSTATPPGAESVVALLVLQVAGLGDYSEAS